MLARPTVLARALLAQRAVPVRFNSSAAPLTPPPPPSTPPPPPSTPPPAGEPKKGSNTGLLAGALFASGVGLWYVFFKEEDKAEQELKDALAAREAKRE